MDTSLFSCTPTVKVFDNRGLTVRDIEFHRHPDSPRTTDRRLTHHQHDARSFLVQSADPRLHARGLANFTYWTDLAGTALRTRSVDAGISLFLADAAGRPVMAVKEVGIDEAGGADKSRAITRTWQYEARVLAGRPLSVTEQVADSEVRIAERFVWAQVTQQALDHNLLGQVTHHYDPAGLARTNSVALTGVPISTTRQLLKEADNPDIVADWQGEEAAEWDTRLAPEAYTAQTTADATGAMLTTLDAAGNLQRVAYDVAGQLRGSWLTIAGKAEQVIVQSLSYSAAGQKLREVHGNGVVTTYTYEPDTQRLASIKTERQGTGAKVLQDLRYAYDPVGNVVKIRNDAEATRFWRNQKVVPENTYRYDSLYQLVSATGREMANAGQPGRHLPHVSSFDSATYTPYTRTYRYDTAGNLLQIRHSAPASNNSYTTDLTVSDRSNRAVLSTLAQDPSAVEALFTPGGQQAVLLPGQPLAWTSRAELEQVVSVKREGATDDRESYRYDSRSQRVLKASTQRTARSTQAQRVIYLPGLELRTHTNGDTLTQKLQVMTVGQAGRAQVRVLHWAAGKPDDLPNDQLRYSYDNLLGSSALEVDGAGNLISQEEYYPFGGTAVWVARNEIEASYKTVRYSGKERDATGLYYYGYRYYQPWAGRWLSADPAGTVDGLNLFEMVQNNPVRFGDKEGLVTFEENFKNSGSEMVYGLAEKRAKYIRLINPSFSIHNNSDALVVDKYNNALAVAIIFGDHAEVKNQEINAGFHMQVTDKDKKAQARKIKVPVDVVSVVKNKFGGGVFNWDAYFEVGAGNSKFNIGAIYSDAAKKYGKDYFHQFQMTSKFFLVPRLLWKRGSKMGLEMAAQKKSVVHFVLDGVDLDAVVDKKGVGGLSVTASELRYAFRNRGRLAGNIFFYKEGVSVLPPWELDSVSWGRYEKSRMSKLQGKGVFNKAVNIFKKR